MSTHEMHGTESAKEALAPSLRIIQDVDRRRNCVTAGSLWRGRRRELRIRLGYCNIGYERNKHGSWDVDFGRDDIPVQQRRPDDHKRYR